MSQNLETTYNPKEIEPRLYDKWLKGKYFHPEPDLSKKPFTTVMPPPNITGRLHMGHALDNTIQDIIIRYKRMQGFDTLWVPGTDHAAISTEVKVTNALKEEGIDKKELGREKFLERTWKWKEEYAGAIEDQLKKLGVSCDWDRERFTMDEGCSKAVEEVFFHLYDKGYMYRGSRIINWCPVCKTSLSDAEVEHEDQDGHFWHIKYPIAGTEDFLEIATTRPETMLGDTAVAVHPDDERYAKYVGKKAILPLVNKEIPIIADSYVDMEFGTGAVKITPAHDPNDFEVGKRHDLEEINIMNDDATINENGGIYAGLDRYKARERIVKDLEEQGLLVKIEPHMHSVGVHDRCHTTVEPLIKQQWFVKMDEMAKPAIDAIEKGELRFVPERFTKIYLHWLYNIKDWCVSRQIWWGHRIPAYYCENCGELIVAKKTPEVCPKCGCKHFTQDEDTLDTWFSSALWPFSTLGWPVETEDLKYYYPTNVLVTGYDIIFFWVIRMVFSGYEQTGVAPFDTVVIHGLVRDELGRKMSKSLGNGVDPLDMIDQFGADALRMFLVQGNAAGNDIRFSDKGLIACRNFANKVWNASRFIIMNLDNADLNTGTDSRTADTKYEDTEPDSHISENALALEKLSDIDAWIISASNNLVREVTDNMEKFEMGIALQKIYDFIWDEFCDWYIELAKYRIYHADEDKESAAAALSTLRSVLAKALKLLHPFLPFISEAIYEKLVPKDESLMITKWPQYSEKLSFPESEDVLEHLKEIVRGIRNIRRDMNVPVGRKATVTVVSKDKALCEALRAIEVNAHALCQANAFVIVENEPENPDDLVALAVKDAVIYMPLAELVDFEQEIARLSKEEERLTKEIGRAKGMLSNEQFLNKAPADKVQAERDKLASYETMLTQIKEELDKWKKKL
ncbi:MAG: valine--tRNA ligase [Lachnospiraceae bacterium]|jgi:valyl-tRNA synthetase|nr:valine--tRNA ligase [Lachnospiraceae bacterium]